MTKIAFMLWAMDFMYGVGWILVTIGILAVIAFLVFAVATGIAWHDFKEWGEEDDKEKFKQFHSCSKRSAITFIVAFVIVALIPSKCTCYAFMAGEVSKLPAVQELTQDARDILDDVKVLIHNQARGNK